MLKANCFAYIFTLALLGPIWLIIQFYITCEINSVSLYVVDFVYI